MEYVDCRTDLYAFGLILRQLFPKRYTRVVRKCTQPQKENQQEQNALDNAIYNFKFMVDSCFNPVDQYVKSDEVKTSNILRDLIYIAKYKSKIRECQIWSQLPKSSGILFSITPTIRLKRRKIISTKQSLYTNIR